MAMTRRSALQFLGAAALSNGLSALVSGCAGFTPGPGSTSSAFDLVVYGGTPAGVIAAVAAARRGAHVALVEPTYHLGGILSNGLGVTDAITLGNIGGLARRFYLDLGRHYGRAPGELQLTFEPHVAERLFSDYLDATGVTVLLGHALSAANKRGATIQHITLDNGTSLQAAQWIDASYEGDLMAAAGVNFTVGREGNAQYGESMAGWGASQYQIDLSPYAGSGSLLPGIDRNPAENAGSADSKVMAYTFRACLSSNPANSIPFPQPDGYSPDRYQGLSEYLKSLASPTLDQIIVLQPTVNSKYCLLANDSIPFSTDYVGGGWNYPNGSALQRRAILDDHTQYVSGLLYFLAHDATVPLQVRSTMLQYGLAADEFAENQHWPWQMYVREARRMIGQVVMTQAEVNTHSLQSDSIGLGNWGIDSHLCDAFAGGAAIVLDGYYFTPKFTYQIPFRCLLPKSEQAANLAVVCCPSSSHIGFSSLRVEPVFMTLGHAAGVAASLALERASSLADVSLPMLQSALVGEGAILAS